MDKQSFCNNCGKYGHVFNQCKIPITSFGIILFRQNPEGIAEYLMIRRRDTLGYIDFLRGKYLVQNKYYIMNMMKQMTQQEKNNLRTRPFQELWTKVWGDDTDSKSPLIEKEEAPASEKRLACLYRNEKINSKDKFETLRMGIYNGGRVFSLSTMLDECDTPEWTEPEWGFPKGRRNYKEKDYDCALREFCEETGFDAGVLKNFQNIFPFEEIFLGSNYKSYKHKYYLTYIDYSDSLKQDIDGFQKSEVSKMEWKTLDDCLASIRNYNLEKKRLLLNIDECLNKYKMCQII
jgi:8-oxo-dGTP pyrophosphatase MutT (NUDIX family)